RRQSRHRGEPPARDRLPRDPRQGRAAVKSVSVARNYAEALFAVGDSFGELIDAVAGAVTADTRIEAMLASPRVSKGAKARILERALQGEARPEFVRFLQAVVRRGRQALF